jgi:hypothetical protein
MQEILRPSCQGRGQGSWGRRLGKPDRESRDQGPGYLGRRGAGHRGAGGHGIMEPAAAGEGEGGGEMMVQTRQRTKEWRKGKLCCYHISHKFVGQLIEAFNVSQLEFAVSVNRSDPTSTTLELSNTSVGHYAQHCNIIPLFGG